ncbi:gamma carbonic anhydrase family protein [Algimonas ampicilliniresistens]|uniref:Gamma carbonic anhydrase family protein n=1 Tax=Algimonas ampicilliniresistens TaxID=1298735 RepID=A0ABQ5V9C0_9PROT|nr:gamma carbonic anhydrase family protein [Algimonas ampicilliniresistens]GLQ23255.1 gamma carbonic anhydrase family protein [Algimonas ampicilliniresistens]
MAVFALDEHSPDLHDSVWVAETASVIGNIIMAEESSVWFGAVMRGDNEPITIGARSNVQDNAVLHSDPGQPLTIGEDVIIGHQVMLHGCTIGDGCLIGIGATVLNGAQIGPGSIVGAHALVTENKVIPPNSLVVGAPGRVIKTLGEAEAQMLKLNAQVYVSNAKRFKDGLRRID